MLRELLHPKPNSLFNDHKVPKNTNSPTASIPPTTLFLISKASPISLFVLLPFLYPL